eukprot:3764165-Alexandrium_andersonii.AAC.1
MRCCPSAVVQVAEPDCLPFALRPSRVSSTDDGRCSRALVANMGCFVAGLLSLFWVLTLCRPWTFIWTNNDIVGFK